MTFACLLRATLLSTDMFTFRFVRLCLDRFQRINSIFLEEALEMKGVIFQSREGFKRALEAYFVLDPIRFKQVSSNSKMSTHGSADLAFSLQKNDWIRANRENHLKLLELAAANWETPSKQGISIGMERSSTGYGQCPRISYVDMGF
jgi:hypothetical protein